MYLSHPIRDVCILKKYIVYPRLICNLVSCTII